jgi:hypothetical protein
MLRPQAENALNGRWLATYRTGFSRSITHASRTPWCLREQTRLQNGSRLATATGGRSSPHTKHRPSLRTLGSWSPRSRRGARRPLIQQSLLAARDFLRPLRLHRCLLVGLRKRPVTLLPSHVQLLSLVGRSRQGSYRLRVRRLDRVALHADLTMRARLSQALAWTRGSIAPTGHTYRGGGERHLLRVSRASPRQGVIAGSARLVGVLPLPPSVSAASVLQPQIRESRRCRIGRWPS